jgi:hypothetical protein
METIPTVTFRGARHTDSLEAYALKHLEKLQKYGPSIVGAHVIIERADRHHRDGNRWHVRINLRVPGEEIVVAHDATAGAIAKGRSRQRLRKGDEVERSHRSAHVAVRSAFASARRRLQDYERRRRGDVKTHAIRRTRVG